MDLLNNLKACTGCTACANICAKGAITMIPNEFGFLYPSVDLNKCVDCGLCHKICPKENILKYPHEGKYVLYGVSRNEDTILSSSSGGAFSELVYAIEQQYENFHCYAATFVNGQVKHICISSSKDLCRQKKSKYTQSYLSDTFSRIKEDLSRHLFVLFVGTPCQVDGLNNYLRHKNYSNLLTIDLLCTGACSPGLFTNHIKYLEQKNKQKVIGYDMRKKVYIDGEWHIMKSEILYSNGDEELKDKDLFIGCFRQHVAFRESCYQCKYTNTHRAGDITLGDYWKQDNDFTEKGFRGISVIIANTEVGKIWAKKLNKLMCLKETNIENIIEQQPALRNPVEKPNYNVPSNISTVEGSVKFMKRYYRGPLKIRILSAISHMLPNNLSTMLKTIYYSLKK